jgi:hypothetical protein
MKTTENRVLSVSYGSFSVKLEGFDEPFTIMRRITEYFRSIAAVDPTFGQKPLIEDLSVLEAIEAAVFNDDVSLSTEGSTITLTPKELEVPRDVFVLGSTDLAPAEEIIAEHNDDADMIVDMNAEQQVALVNTPLDLREMAQNHQEMPFVGKGPQALDDTALNDTAPEQPVETDELEAILAQLDTPALENDVSDVTKEPEVSETVDPQEPIEPPTETITEVAAAPKYRSLSLSDFEPAKPEEPEAVEPQKDMAAEITAAIAGLSAQDPQNEAVEDVVTGQPNEPAVDLRDQTPVEKRPLRIIRNEYAYEEPAQSKTQTAALEAPSIAVNPFRKFPKRDAEVAPVQAAPVQEATPALEDDFVVTYRKLRAEHG